MPGRTARARRTLATSIALSGLVTGCASFGPPALQQSRLQYNEVVKTSTEEQLLLNIVRLRYTDTPSSLAVSSVAAQYEVTRPCRYASRTTR
jgi:hypothetical protein